MLANAEWEQPAGTVQQVAPTSSLDEFVSTLFALSRLPAGLWTILTLSEIDRMNRKSVQATLDVLVRAMGVPRTEVYHYITEAEAAGFLRSRLVRRHHLAYTITSNGRIVLEEARHLTVPLGGSQKNQTSSMSERAGSTHVTANVNTAPSSDGSQAHSPVRSRARPPSTTH